MKGRFWSAAVLFFVLFQVGRLRVVFEVRGPWKNWWMKFGDGYMMHSSKSDTSKGTPRPAGKGTRGLGVFRQSSPSVLTLAAIVSIVYPILIYARTTEGRAIARRG